MVPYIAPKQGKSVTSTNEKIYERSTKRKPKEKNENVGIGVPKKERKRYKNMGKKVEILAGEERNV